MNQLRREKLRQYICKKEQVTLKELCDLCPEVSLMSIHRDLNALQEEGVLVKMRGGARAVNHSADPRFEVRERENNPAKALMARKALTLIQPGSSVFLDAGTSSLAIAREAPDMELNIFTTGPNIALELRFLTRPSINLCCGNLNRSNLAVSGHSTLEMLEKINIDLAFIGVSGCSAESGFTCGKESEMLVKQLVISKARTSVLLCDHTKFTKLMPFTFARPRDVDYLIGDGRLPEAFVRAAGADGLKIL